jgi:hypothetical protein
VTGEPQAGTPAADVAVAVLDEPRVLEPRRAAAALSPAVVQTAAMVGVSLVAGAAAVALVHRRRVRRLARRRRLLPPVLASRSFLVDVRVLGERK